MDGLMAARHVRREMHKAGLGRTSTMSGGGITGWTSNLGMTGFSVRRHRETDAVVWNVVVSGKAHLAYERDPAGDPDLQRPVRPENLVPAVRTVFQDMGMQVSAVEVVGWSGMWDDDVDYAILTNWPEWLEFGNVPEPPMAEGLRAIATFTTGSRFEQHFKLQPVVSGLVGYIDGEDALLTRESVDRLVSTATPHSISPSSYRNVYIPVENQATVSFDGQELVFRYWQAEVLRAKPESVTNAWGDEVETWRVHGRTLDRQANFAPSVPFLMSGSMRIEARDADIYAQYFPEPAQASGPRGP